MVSSDTRIAAPRRGRVRCAFPVGDAPLGCGVRRRRGRRRLRAVLGLHQPAHPGRSRGRRKNDRRRRHRHGAT